MKYFAGLDVSLQETAVCVVDEDGIVGAKPSPSRGAAPRRRRLWRDPAR
jgi:hypothetical protein